MSNIDRAIARAKAYAPAGPLVFQDLAVLATEVERLQAIVAKLPKCWRLNDAGQLVQDVPMVPNMGVFVQSRRSPASPRYHVLRVFGNGVSVSCFPGEPKDVIPEDCYDTREAAEAEKEE
jgi:hypothetical protein